ncbi:MAG TPA: TrbI/VirB10 family protein [Gammaproteobacteria bacterium]|nr:TrbI/VirB10 family protein [Gammaproteobacteria bacterium]
MKIDLAEKNKQTGLPEISEAKSRKMAIKLIVGGIVSVLLMSLIFHSKPAQKVEKPVEETYVPENQAADAAKPQAEAQQQASPEVVQAQAAVIEQKQKELAQRLTAPLMMVNNKVESTKQTRNTPSVAQSNDPNMQFMNQVSTQANDAVNVSVIGPMSAIIAEGSLIHADLESAVDSDLPGYLRAIVNVPVYSEDGSQVLIPRGSRLIGEYKSGMLQGQSRFFVVWTRLITPEGLSVNLGSPGVDNLGVAGMDADEIDRHFWQQFGTASLLSLIGAGAANVGVSEEDQNNSAAAYRAAVASSFSQSANQSLKQGSTIAPTLKKYQGKSIIVFVAHDLNFQGAIKQTHPQVNIF